MTTKWTKAVDANGSTMIRENDKWITSNAVFAGAWHWGRYSEMRGDKTGKVFSRYWLAACNGKQLGGPWGQRSQAEQPPLHGICARCAKLAGLK